MLPLLFVLFIAMPILEIFVLIKVGSSLGVWTTIAIVILTAVIGSYMLRAQSLATIRSVQDKLNTGQVPAIQMFEGIALLVGGIFLLTPGFITDAIGFFCLFPPTRRWLLSRVLAKASVAVFQAGPSANDSPYQKPSGSTNPTGQSSSNVIDGEYRRED